MMEKFKLKLGEKDLIVEINDLAEQASGSCLVQYGDTLVLATAVMSEQKREGIDYFPLSVNYEERHYAAGKILGSRYMRREGRPSDGAILTSRLIDRAIRPLFPKGLKKEVQVIITCLSWDKENDPDILGLLAASISLLISDIPWSGPIAPLRIGQEKEKFIINPTYAQREQSSLDLTTSAVEQNNEVLINMIEAEAKEIDEETVSRAIEWAKPYFKKLINFQNQITKKVAKEKVNVEIKELDLKLKQEIKQFLGNKLEKALEQKIKEEQSQAIKQVSQEVIDFVEEKYPEQDKTAVKDFLEQELKDLVYQNILEKEKRPDNRKLDQVRKLSCQAGLLPRTHGSGLFIRGKTKTLSILTLGSPGDVKLFANMEMVGEKRFMHHYNFPPYSVGEVKPIRGPGRREIGHGMLGEKALKPVIPDAEQFPYTIRIVSEILSSNGSSSMASVCASSLALMDAGVPIKAPVAGIALGLIKKGKDYKILTDIQGLEDHYGSMDFKIAGTKKGITAIQMDVKIDGISTKILKESLVQAQKARFEILDEIKKTISKPRPELSPFAPRILTIQINPDKIRDVIGKGGKIINEIIQECNVSIDIEETGQVFITSESEESAQKAVEWIEKLTREARVGESFQGTVKKIMDFGAFVEILPGQEGLIHISKLSPGRVEKVTDVVNLRDIVDVKVISIDEQGRINLLLNKVIKKA